MSAKSELKKGERKGEKKTRMNDQDTARLIKHLETRNLVLQNNVLLLEQDLRARTRQQSTKRKAYEAIRKSAIKNATRLASEYESEMIALKEKVRVGEQRECMFLALLKNDPRKCLACEKEPRSSQNFPCLCVPLCFDCTLGECSSVCRECGAPVESVLYFQWTQK